MTSATGGRRVQDFTSHSRAIHLDLHSLHLPHLVQLLVYRLDIGNAQNCRGRGKMREVSVRRNNPP
jgi:hypothetical protein